MRGLFVIIFTFLLQSLALAQPTVVIQTNYGDIYVELDRDKAPLTVDNFISYINDHFYDNTLFHRVIPGFMIQGGGFDTNFVQKLTKPEIKNESQNGLKNKRGTIAMARKSAPDTASSQFFINLVDNDFLDYKDAERPGYAVFGNVIEGMDIVDTISKLKTAAHPPLPSDVPISHVIIESIRLQLPEEEPMTTEKEEK